jgi:hypothetical protein
LAIVELVEFIPARRLSRPRAESHQARRSIPGDRGPISGVPMAPLTA